MRLSPTAERANWIQMVAECAATPSTTLSFTVQGHARPLLGLGAVTGGCLGRGELHHLGEEEGEP